MWLFPTLAGPKHRDVMADAPCNTISYLQLAPTAVCHETIHFRPSRLETTGRYLNFSLGYPTIGAHEISVYSGSHVMKFDLMNMSRSFLLNITV